MEILTYFCENWEDIVTHMCLFLFFCFGLMLNIGVIVMIINLEELSSLSNYLLLNLFVSDLVFAFTIPLDLTANWLNANLCKMIQYTNYISSHSSFFTLVLVAFERFVAITRPLRHICLRRRVCLLFYLTVIWALSILFSIPTLMIANEGAIQCGFKMPWKKAEDIV